MPLRRLRSLWYLVLDNYLLLLAGAVVALVWANVDGASYERVAHVLHFPVNDVLMAFFFALATKEIVEATFPGGALSSPRKASLPLLAAIGGMAVPAVLYRFQVAAVGAVSLESGWAIPCATDIAFSYMAARLVFGARHPAIPFLLLLAIADDALGLVLLAVFYPTGAVSPVALVTFLGAAIAAALWFRRRRIRRVWPYVIVGGGLSWTAMFLGGLHPALALVPIVPFMPHVARDLGYFNIDLDGHPDTMHAFEQWWRIPVQGILFLFALANAGVTISSVGDATWIVVTSLVIGKPIGILLMTFVGASLGLRLPIGLSYLHVGVAGIAAGVGFTVALFFATAAFPAGPELEQAKLGALLSFAAFPLAVAAGRLLRIRPAIE